MSTDLLDNAAADTVPAAADAPKIATVGGAKLTIQPDGVGAASAVSVAPVQEVSFTDARGRLIKLNRPSVVAEFRFVEAIGDAAKNEMFFNMALPILFVTSIDNVPVSMPHTKDELYATISRLGEEGMVALGQAMASFNLSSSQEEEKNG